MTGDMSAAKYLRAEAQRGEGRLFLWARRGRVDVALRPRWPAFKGLVGFNISERQVRYANERAIRGTWLTSFRFAWEKPSGLPAS
jgi:hypothetical protein